MKRIFVGAVCLTIAFVLVFAVFCILNFSCYERAASLLSAVSGVVATIAFGFWVSYIFQRMNDISTKKKNDELTMKIREREFLSLRSALSTLVKHFNMLEDYLVLKLEKMDLKSSFSEDDIDVENLAVNYFVFMSVYKDIDSFVGNENDKDYVKLNIERLLMKDPLKMQSFGEITVRISDTYFLFKDFNLICIELSKKMPQINLDYQLEIFKADEIAAVSAFSTEVGIGHFINFYPPYEIIQLFYKLLAVQSFIKAEFIPHYHKNSLWEDLQKSNEAKKTFENMVDGWMDNYREKAAKKLKPHD